VYQGVAIMNHKLCRLHLRKTFSMKSAIETFRTNIILQALNIALLSVFSIYAQPPTILTVGHGKTYSTITNAIASIPQPFTSDYIIQVDVPSEGFAEPGLDVDASALAMNGHTFDITGVPMVENNVTYYFGDDLEYRINNGVVATIENVVAGENLARRVQNDTYVPDAEYEYLIKNHLGSTMMTTRENGTLAGSVYDYFPYGKQEVVLNLPSPKITQTFTGKELDLYDGETVTGEDGEGRYYFGRRYYDPEVGAFTSTDPANQFWSPYTFCGGNPINFVDEDGALAEVGLCFSQIYTMSEAIPAIEAIQASITTAQIAQAFMTVASIGFNIGNSLYQNAARTLPYAQQPETFASWLAQRYIDPIHQGMDPGFGKWAVGKFTSGEIDATANTVSMFKGGAAGTVENSGKFYRYVGEGEAILPFSL
jgi:RHS repeat-associated protein